MMFRIFRWEQALVSTSDPPPDKILEGLYNVKITRFFSTPNDHGTIQSRNSSRRRRRRRTLLSQTEKCVKNCILNKLREVRISGFRTKLQSEEP